MALEIDLDHTLDTFRLNVTLVSRGSVLVLFGASGSGKTLTLKALAGILDPRAGRVAIDGDILFDSSAGIDLSPQDRRLGYVPQNYALFPHLTVRENIEFGLRGSHDHAASGKVKEVLSLLRLEGLESRLPGEISGGQQQRVALARALSIQPRMLLLDEPFSALDRLLVENLRQDLKDLQQQLSLRIVLVTHDLDDVRALGDEVAFFEAGRLLEVGPVETVLNRPRSLAVARLTGGHNLNVLRAVKRQGRLCFTFGGAEIPARPEVVAQEGDYSVQITRGAMQVLEPDGAGAPGEAVVEGSLRRVVPGDDQLRLFVHVEGLERELETVAPAWWWRRHPRVIGETLRVAVPAEALHVFEAESR